MCDLVQAEEPAEELGSQEWPPFWPGSSMSRRGSFISHSPFVGSCFKMLDFVLTGLEKTLVASKTLNFKKFNSYGGGIDRVVALLILLHHRPFSFRM